MNYDKAHAYALKRLEKELPKHLYYHGKHHTIDVLDAAEKIADFEGISKRDSLFEEIEIEQY